LSIHNAHQHIHTALARPTTLSHLVIAAPPPRARTRCRHLNAPCRRVCVPPPHTSPPEKLHRSPCTRRCTVHNSTVHATTHATTHPPPTHAPLCWLLSRLRLRLRRARGRPRHLGCTTPAPPPAGGALDSTTRPSGMMHRPQRPAPQPYTPPPTRHQQLHRSAGASASASTSVVRADASTARLHCARAASRQRDYLAVQLDVP
jgi:hypothetical protein